MEDRDVAGKGVLGLSVSASRIGGRVAQAGKVLGLQVLARARQVTANVVA